MSTGTFVAYEKYCVRSPCICQRTRECRERLSNVIIHRGRAVATRMLFVQFCLHERVMVYGQAYGSSDSRLVRFCSSLELANTAGTDMADSL